MSLSLCIINKASSRLVQRVDGFKIRELGGYNIEESGLTAAAISDPLVGAAGFTRIPHTQIFLFDELAACN